MGWTQLRPGAVSLLGHRHVSETGASRFGGRQNSPACLRRRGWGGRLLGLGCCQAWPAVHSPGPGGPAPGAKGPKPWGQTLAPIPQPSLKHLAQGGGVWTLSSVSLSNAQLGTWPSPGAVWCTSFRADVVTKCLDCTPPMCPSLRVSGCPQCVAHSLWGAFWVPQGAEMTNASGLPYSWSPSQRSRAAGGWPKDSSPPYPFPN